MEETKCLKPSDSGSRIGDRASVQAATRVNAEQASHDEGLVKGRITGTSKHLQLLRYPRWQIPEFAEAPAHAREARAHFFADQVVQIADSTDRDFAEYVTKSGDVRLVPNHAAAARDRLRCDMRWRLMGKWAPKVYGDMQRLELTGPNGGPILMEQITLVAMRELETDKTSATREPQVIDNNDDRPAALLPSHPLNHPPKR